VFFYALFTGLTFFAWNFMALAVMRFITGLAIGSEWSTGIALVSETWPDRARPKGCGMLHSGFGGGALLASAVWFLLAMFQPMGTESWRLIFLAGALPALCVLYLRRALDESEKWVAAVKAERLAAGGGKVEGSRPFTLAEIFRDPESRRRVLLTTILSFVTTCGWWAVSSWMPAYTEQLARLHGEVAGVWAPRMSIIYNVGAICAYVSSGFIADAIGRKPYMAMTFAGSLVLSIISYTWTGDLATYMVIAFFNGVFTLGFGFSWMAIYLVELFSTPVRATAAGFIFNAARLVAWIFPIIAGQLVVTLGGLSSAALTMASVYVIGMILPWLLPETKGRPLPA
jgi:MFS family permease